MAQTSVWASMAVGPPGRAARPQHDVGPRRAGDPGANSRNGSRRHRDRADHQAARSTSTRAPSRAHEPVFARSHCDSVTSVGPRGVRAAIIRPGQGTKKPRANPGVSVFRRSSSVSVDDTARNLTRHVPRAQPPSGYSSDPPGRGRDHAYERMAAGARAGSPSALLRVSRSTALAVARPDAHVETLQPSAYGAGPRRSRRP